MKSPIVRQVWYLQRQVEASLEKVYRYQVELEAYSASRTPEQRGSDVESVLSALNTYALEFASSGVLAPCEDIRVIYGLYVRLDTWHDILRSCNPEDYLDVMHEDCANPMSYLLQPKSQAEAPLRVLVVPKDEIYTYLSRIEQGLRDSL